MCLKVEGRENTCEVDHGGAADAGTHCREPPRHVERHAACHEARIGSQRELRTGAERRDAA